MVPVDADPPIASTQPSHPSAYSIKALAEPKNIHLSAFNCYLGMSMCLYTKNLNGKKVSIPLHLRLRLRYNINTYNM